VYRCPPGGGLQAVHALQDADPGEDFYCCAWSVDTPTGAPLLLLGGKNALLQVVNCATGWLDAVSLPRAHGAAPVGRRRGASAAAGQRACCGAEAASIADWHVFLLTLPPPHHHAPHPRAPLRTQTLEGHGQCINDIAVHPTRPHLVVTASKDTSLRLWNLRSRVCVLVFQGDGGHRNEALSVDWAPGGGLELVSAGMDNAVKVWSLGAFAATLDASEAWPPGGGAARGAFPTRHVTVPSFSTHAVHWNYVDCVRWLGGFLLSKSVDDRVVCWQPDPGAGPGTATVGGGTRGLRLQREGGPGAWRGRDGGVRFVQELQLEDCRDVWWVRFGLDQARRVLAVGTSLGRVLVFDPHALGAAPRARLTPRRAAGKSDAALLVRQTAVSWDGGIIAACHEDGSVTRFDAVDAVAERGRAGRAGGGGGGEAPPQEPGEGGQQRRQPEQQAAAEGLPPVAGKVGAAAQGAG
jgi:polycomb protein EED